ncbi:endonuclease/exonuclease/phosphatase family protein [Pseudonocardia sp. GCM10023141]|uniref:endonuclease/exonuclease/phosphatase family protein n=1 Tax=Pseudonocardia sp. GCM10023141 TaxID=3252653 RepID=UPI003619BAA4
MTFRHTVSGLALTAAAAAVVLPDRLRIDHRFPFVDVVAWRPHATLALGAGAALLATRRGARPVAAALGAVALAAAPSVIGRVLPRRAVAPADSDGPGREITVLALNVLVGRADTGAVATLLERERPDLVALPEAGPDYRDKLLPLVAGMGYRAWVSTEPGTSDVASVTMLAAESAGDLDVRTGPEMRRRYVRATGGILGSRSFIAVHPEAPVGPNHTRQWRADMEQLAHWCHEPDAPIVAGDFNATLDHALMREAMGPTRSAAAGTGRGLDGTFPVAFPRRFGIQIDHVLVPAGAVTTRFEILEVPGTDHRGVLTRIRLPRS